MASLLRVDGIQNTNLSNLITQTNTTTITVGVSGQTITIPSGATLSSASAGTYATTGKAIAMSIVFG
jgi:hypothetical protein